MRKSYSTSYMLWAGDDQSFDLYMQAQQKFANTTPEQAGVVLTPADNNSGTADDKPKSRLLQIEDGVALINIAGTLTNEVAWWNKYAGLVAYDEIRQAIHEAAASEATQVLIYFNSPGGAVAGLKDVVDSMVALSKVKPTSSYTDSQATSAAYWLMAGTKKRYASDVATLGSIGVIARAFEYTKMMEEEGISVEVARSGEYKALIHPTEKVTEKARAEMNEKVMYLGGIFAGSVADLLKTSKQAIMSQEARTYIGQQAVDVGLVDGIMSFDELYVKLLRKAAKSGINTSTGGIDMKKKYTNLATAMAAVSAGVTEEPTAEEVKAAEEAAAKAAEEAAAEAAEEAAAEGDAAGAEDGSAAPAATAAPEVPKPAVSEVVVLLKEQLKEAQTGAVSAQAEMTALKKKFDALEASVAPLKEIVAQAINNMLVPLNSPPDAALKDLAPEALVERHKAVAENFTSWYKTGGVSSVHADTDSGEEEAVSVSPLERARLKLFRPADKNNKE